MNSDGAVRSHAGNEYYGSVAERPNLHLLTEAMVEKIILEEVSDEEDAASVTATSVSYTRGGQRTITRACKEVLLAAGVYQTPQLLELSGIGSPQLLSRFGIDVYIDNSSVGENLQDHCMKGLCVELKEDVPTGDMRGDVEFLKAAERLYETQRTGPLVAVFPSFAFMPLAGWVPNLDDSKIPRMFNDHLESKSESPTRPSQQEQYTSLRSRIESSSSASIKLCLGASQVHFDKSTYSDVFSVTQPGHYVAFLVSLPHPFRMVMYISSPNLPLTYQSLIQGLYLTLSMSKS